MLAHYDVFVPVLEWIARVAECSWRTEDDRSIICKVTSQPSALLHVRCKDGGPTKPCLVVDEGNGHIL